MPTSLLLLSAGLSDSLGGWGDWAAAPRQHPRHNPGRGTPAPPAVSGSNDDLAWDLTDDKSPMPQRSRPSGGRPAQGAPGPLQGGRSGWGSPAADSFSDDDLVPRRSRPVQGTDWSVPETDPSAMSGLPGTAGEPIHESSCWGSANFGCSGRVQCRCVEGFCSASANYSAMIMPAAAVACQTDNQLAGHKRQRLLWCRQCCWRDCMGHQRL